MNELTRKMRETAKKLLSEGQVKFVVGWEKGTFAHVSPPVFVANEGEVERLIWDEYCLNNLAKYLLDYKHMEGKIALFVKGCDSRGVNRLLQDKQVERDKVYLIGIPCPGLKDSKCRSCTHHNPLVYDELLGPEVEEKEPEVSRFEGIGEMEQMHAQAKYEFWTKQYEKCIRCYACRNICPACNCRECIFDQGQQWLDRTVELPQNQFYGLTRAFHVAGRCIECGECQRVCPMEIPIMKLNKKIAKDIDQLFGPYEAGLNLEEQPPLGFYKTDDPEEFM